MVTPASFLSPHVAFEVATYSELHRSKPRPTIAIGTREARLRRELSSLAARKLRFRAGFGYAAYRG